MRRGLIVLLFCVSAFAKRGVTPEDYFAFENINDPHLSPDGKQVAYVVGTVDQKKNRRVTSIWLVSTAGSAEPRRLTAEGFNANSPRWSPDGSKLCRLSRGSNGSGPCVVMA
jgi:acylaminoacyl-peptidase